MLVNWLPLSGWISTSAYGFRRQTAISNACKTTSVDWRLCIDQSTTRREMRSMTSARWAKPYCVRISVSFAASPDDAFANFFLQA